MDRLLCPKPQFKYFQRISHFPGKLGQAQIQRPQECYIRFSIRIGPHGSDPAGQDKSYMDYAWTIREIMRGTSRPLLQPPLMQLCLHSDCIWPQGLGGIPPRCFKLQWKIKYLTPRLGSNTSQMLQISIQNQVSDPKAKVVYLPDAEKIHQKIKYLTPRLGSDTSQMLQF